MLRPVWSLAADTHLPGEKMVKVFMQVSGLSDRDGRASLAGEATEDGYGGNGAVSLSSFP